MDQYVENTERLKVRTNDPISNQDARRIREALDQVEGAELYGIAGAVVTVDRDPALVSERMIVQMIDRLGIRRRMPKKEGRFARRLRMMAENNKKQFGNGRLDCCDLPKD